MTKYKLVCLSQTPIDLETELNYLGEQGWKVVCPAQLNWTHSSKNSYGPEIDTFDVDERFVIMELNES